MIALIVAAIALTSTDAGQAEPKPCPRISAPAVFEVNKTNDDGVGRTNTGIIPSGFVDLPAAPVVHGIDVSKYQDAADFQSVADCGGRFAYVRLSGGTNPDNELLYRTHWANARAAGLVPGPYHNLSILPDDARRFRDGSLDTLRQQAPGLIEASAAYGGQQADLFIERLQEMLSLDPGGARSALPWLPIALDLSSRPMAGKSPEYAREFGRLYQATMCGFIEKIRRSKFGQRPIVLFLSPADFVEYGLEVPRRCGGTDIPPPLIWIRFRSSDGLGFRSGIDKALTARICGEDAARADVRESQTRCRFEQYTSFGGFAVFQQGAPLDLDRFYGTEQDFLKLAGGAR